MDPLLALRAAEARGFGGAEQASSLGDAKAEGPGSFAETLERAVKGADRLQHEADETVRRFASGDVDDVHQVMLALDRADLSFRMTLEVRNKLVEAYQEVMRLQA
jgi:flagellar hook-basal body complex protein FliE